MIKVSCTLNGQPTTFECLPDEVLLKVLRNRLGLTGTKYGCGEGECGTCTVIVNGKSTNSCLLLAGQVEGAQITTIEGLAASGELDPLQQAFIECGAVQCGYCTPGMIMVAKALLGQNPHPTRKEIQRAIGGNLCRCTGYKKIIEAIERVAARG